jgi:putative RNA 2'-phosphotransferase
MKVEDLVRLSRTISHALRHKPDQYGLTLDEEGWVAVPDLLAALTARRREWQHLDEEDLRTMMVQADKQRFELRDGRIRAFYGHSVPQKVERVPATPPPVLFHGTTPQAAAFIRREGLRPMRRQYVHLSADEATALQVGRRRTGSPVLLKIDAERAARNGVAFYLGNDMVWLADAIPPEFIR